MIGAIVGDVIGSVYEWNNIKTEDFPLFSPKCFFTDDSVLTIAVAKAVMEESGYAAALKDVGRPYPNSGYGGNFQQWIYSDTMGPYNSWGNGSAMRVSPVGFAFDTVERVLDEARKSAVITHNHPEGIKGAQATALAIFRARAGASKDDIKEEIQQRFDYDLDRSIAEIRPVYTYDVSCQGSVPEAIIAFLEAESFEDAIRKAISIGGDSDTIACITGGIAQAAYDVPSDIAEQALATLTPHLLEIAQAFCKRYGIEA